MLSRRQVLKTAACAALTAAVTPRSAFSAPSNVEITEITPELIKAAQQEGTINFYTTIELEPAEALARAFEAKFSGMRVQVERTGSSRLLQRIGQEYQSNINRADVVNASDAAAYIEWKKNDWLAPFATADILKLAPQYRDPDSCHAVARASLSVLGFNTNLVQAGDAPKKYADLLDAQWKDRIVKAHPGYNGTTLTQTFALVRAFGWEYFEKLATQNVFHVQSSTESPRKLAGGERMIMGDGAEYTMFSLKDQGAPIEIIYPDEGVAFIGAPSSVMKRAANPNAAKLFSAWMFTPEAQTILVNIGNLRSVHPEVKAKDTHRPLQDIKLFDEDAAGLAEQSKEIKSRYASIFGV